MIYVKKLAHPAEKRRHPRLQLFASVELVAGDATHVLHARNLSLGGVLLDATGVDRDLLPVGSRHELLLFDAADEKTPPVRILGEVVRHDAGAVAFSWIAQDADTTRRLSRLFETLRPVRLPLPPSTDEELEHFLRGT